MLIRKATSEDFEKVKSITHETINAIYPHYYPQGAVKFFLAHHCDENIARDIEAGIVWLLTDEEFFYGTVTVHENEIGRLFVHPEHQGFGYGRMLLDFAEAKIAESYDEIVIDASMSAKQIYKKRGYVEVGFNVVPAFGDYLCYDIMKKELKNE